MPIKRMLASYVAVGITFVNQAVNQHQLQVVSKGRAFVILCSGLVHVGLEF